MALAANVVKQRFPTWGPSLPSGPLKTTGGVHRLCQIFMLTKIIITHLQDNLLNISLNILIYNNFQNMLYIFYPVSKIAGYRANPSETCALSQFHQVS